MDLTLVKKLVKLLSESNVDEIEIEEEGKKVRIAKHPDRAGAPVSMPVNSSGVGPVSPASIIQATIPQAQPSGLPTPTPTPTAPVESTANLREVRSPIVGTFYRAPAPDASPFVEIGSTIQPGTVLCIIEAMKLMNEIESDVAGKVAKVLVENGQPVEYDQLLFLIDQA
jgi:acetyl-CoA carboxylase biotin carboxyl carrier protein